MTLHLKYVALSALLLLSWQQIPAQVLESQVGAASSPVQPSAIISQAAQAFSNSRPVTSVVMTGTATWTAGATKATGPVKLTAMATGENSAEFNLNTGTRVETESAIGDDRRCGWTSDDGKQHDGASSNCWSATIWFLPHLALQSQGQPPALIASALNGSSHIQHSLHIAPTGSPAAVTDLIAEWSRTDLTLDSTTQLPTVLRFNIHPDQHSEINLPVEVHYSDYKVNSGVQLPMHIERYVNGSLQVSIDVDSATIN